MTYQQACRLSEVGIAVRCRGDLVQYWTWDPDAQKTPSPKAPARDVQPRAARLVDHRYAPIYQDWLPWMPRDGWPRASRQ